MLDNRVNNNNNNNNNNNIPSNSSSSISNNIRPVVGYVPVPNSPPKIQRIDL